MNAETGCQDELTDGGAEAGEESVEWLVVLERERGRGLVLKYSFAILFWLVCGGRWGRGYRVKRGR